MEKSDIRKAKEMLAVTNNIQRVYVRKLVRMRKNALNKALKLYENTQNIDLLTYTRCMLFVTASISFAFLHKISRQI